MKNGGSNCEGEWKSKRERRGAIYPRLSTFLFHSPLHFLSPVLHPLTLLGPGTKGTSHQTREPLNAHQARSQGVRWAVASPAQRNWGGQEKSFSSTPFRLLGNPFFKYFLSFWNIWTSNFSSSIFRNGVFYSSAKIKINLISPTLIRKLAGTFACNRSEEFSIPTQQHRIEQAWLRT